MKTAKGPLVGVELPAPAVASGQNPVIGPRPTPVLPMHGGISPQPPPQLSVGYQPPATNAPGPSHPASGPAIFPPTPGK